MDPRRSSPTLALIIVALSDIGIPNGSAIDSTRDLLKAHYPKNKKIREPKMY
jgi:hypothetical protein